MCQCFQIGGPFIAEDPDCPVHGRDAQRREIEIDDLRDRIREADSVEELRAVMLDLIQLLY
jgi:hypothetical protein